MTRLDETFIPVELKKKGYRSALLKPHIHNLKFSDVFVFFYAVMIENIDSPIPRQDLQQVCQIPKVIQRLFFFWILWLEFVLETQIAKSSVSAKGLGKHM